MKMNFLVMLLIGQLAFITKINAQNIAINGTGSLPDTSAMLDVSSTIKGFLAPRMTTAQQDLIPLPAKGLLVFNTSLNMFKVNTGTSTSPLWTSLSSGGGGTISSVNGLSTPTQTFGTGTTGTDFNIVSSGTTHTFHIPDASTGGRGFISTGAQSFTGTKTFNTGITATGGTINLNADATSNGVNIGTATNTGTVAIGGTGIQSINVGTGTGIKTIGMGTGAAANVIAIGSTTGAASLTQRVGTGNFSLDGAGSSGYAIGASTTTGTLTIGGTAQTGAITLGSSSGTNTVNIGTGTGATTLNIGTGGTGINTIGIGTGAAANAISIGSTTLGASLRERVGTGHYSLDGVGSSTYSIGASTTTGTLTIGGTAQTGAITIASSSAAQTLNLGTGTGVATVNIGTGGTVSYINIGDNVGSTSGTTLIGGSTTINGGLNFGISTNTTDDYTVTLSPAPTAYNPGMIVLLKVTTSNSGPSTINVNGLGVKSIKKGTKETSGNNIDANGICLLVYDGTGFQLLQQ